MAQGISTSAKIEGVAGLRSILDQLPKEIRLTVLAAAVAAAAVPVEAAAKNFASKRSGALRKSIRTVVRNSPSKSSAVAVVGPSRDYFRGGRRLKNGANRNGAERPANYAHLVEFGHAVRKPKKGRTIRKGNAAMPADGKLTWVPPRPFMRPAIAATKNLTSRALLDGAQRGIEKARDRLVSQYGHKP